jgi:polar amino acid transport system substrate-binding protein
MTRALGWVTVLVLTAVLLAGCGSGEDRAQRMTLAALDLPAPHASAATPSPSAPRCHDVTASLRPPRALPAPGKMPAGSYMARIERRGYLIAGVDQNTLLFAYFNPLRGRIEGFEIDLLKQLARAIFGNRPGDIRFKAITTAERIPAVQDGSVDVVADAVTVTCQRRRQVDFSTVYYDAGQRILVPSDSTARRVQDLDGKPVCATIGSTSLDTLEHVGPGRAPNPRGPGGRGPIPYPVAQRTDCLVALQQGLVAGVTSDDSILLGFQAQDPYTKIVGPRFADEPYGMAISKAHPEFVRFVNGVLAQMRSNGRWRADYSRWLGKLTATVPAPPPAHYGG